MSAAIAQAISCLAMASHAAAVSMSGGKSSVTLDDAAFMAERAVLHIREAIAAAAQEATAKEAAE